MWLHSKIASGWSENLASTIYRPPPFDVFTDNVCYIKTENRCSTNQIGLNGSRRCHANCKNHHHTKQNRPNKRKESMIFDEYYI